MVAANGAALVAEALLKYRPRSVYLLTGAIGMLRKERARACYLGDLVWLAAKANYKDFGVKPYSEYSEGLDKPRARRDEDENERARQAAVGMLSRWLKKG